MRDSFVDPELREHLSDLLYRVQLRDRRDAYVYTLIEHKSYPFPEVAFQLLRYMVQAWEMLRRQYGMLVPIVPIVVYHGAVTWKQGDRLHDLFVDLPPALQPYTPDFRYWLCDLSHISDAEMQGAALLRATLLALLIARLTFYERSVAYDVLREGFRHVARST